MMDLTFTAPPEPLQFLAYATHVPTGRAGQLDMIRRISNEVVEARIVEADGRTLTAPTGEFRMLEKWPR